MSKTILVLIFLCVFIASNCQNYKIMVVTGGHSYDTISFFEMFDQLECIDYEHFAQPGANEQLSKRICEKFDVLVFYDMWKDINERQKKAYLDLTIAGKPFLFLHHSIASYQDWPEFEKIIGGKYTEQGEGTSKSDISTYQHDVWVDYKALSHSPVTSGLDSFRLFDEVYGTLRISNEVSPLLSTTHPRSSEYVAWENRYNKSTIIYLQPGHDSNAYSNAKYRQLLLQAIRYLANKKNQQNNSR